MKKTQKFTIPFTWTAGEIANQIYDTLEGIAYEDEELNEVYNKLSEKKILGMLTDSICQKWVKDEFDALQDAATDERGGFEYFDDAESNLTIHLMVKLKILTGDQANELMRGY